MEERRYRAYITDAQMILVENIAHAFGGKILSKRWVEDYIQDERTGDEIAAEVIKNAGLIIKGGETEWN